MNVNGTTKEEGDAFEFEYYPLHRHDFPHGQIHLQGNDW
jgi:hypothetical protein